jgi:hypothetical protein
MPPAMTRYRSDDGRPLALTRQIAAGGEGEVWATDRDGQAAKLYRARGPDRFAKLRAMIARPPALGADPAAQAALAWPTAVVEAVDGDAPGPAGFLMPAVAGRVLTAAIRPSRRRRELPGFDWLSLHAVAYNLCWLVGRLHAAGYVLGDLKPDNLLVDEDGLVALVDLDSIQVTDRNAGRVFRAPTGSDGFTAPELVGELLSSVERTELHDRYALAVVVHLLLFARHPGRNAAAQGTVGPDAAHPDLTAAFARAFDGAPRRRPAAGDWCAALAAAIDDLRPCPEGAGHFRAAARGGCPWCARLAATGVDPFPPAPAGRMPKASLLRRVSVALADGDDESLSRLWRASAWLRAQRLPPALQTRIAAAESRAGALERLRGLLIAGPACLADDEAALRLWDGPPGLALNRAACADRALAGGVEGCRRRLRSARRLHAAIARARATGALTPAGETEVVDAYREAISAFELRPADLEPFRGRAEEAAARLRAWDRLDRALAERDDPTALSVWRGSANLLAGFAPADAVAGRLREARERVAGGRARVPAPPDDAVSPAAALS